jgi:S-DNA-T family DNA segregation ATPase FtsK/SpoIIIE
MSSSPITRANIIPISLYASRAQTAPEGSELQAEAARAERDGPREPSVNPVSQEAKPEWEKHFFMAPNVRFTRTPDNAVTKKQSKAAAEPTAGSSPDEVPPAPVVVRDHVLELVHDADDRPAEAVDEPAAPAAAAKAESASPTSGDVWALLSDHAFFELAPPLSPKGEIVPAPKPVAGRVVSVPPRTVAPAVAARPRPSESDPASLYRVIDCSVGTGGKARTSSEDAASGRLAQRPAGQTTVRAIVPAAPPASVRPPVLPEPMRIEAEAFGEGYSFPPIDLLQDPPMGTGVYLTQERLEQGADLLESVLEDFGVKGEIIHVRAGPVVTLYEFEPAPGVKSSRVINLADDIARSMSAVSARVAVVPGRNAIGIELPNDERETVYFRELIESDAFGRSNAKLALALGKDIGGQPVVADLARMPHLLVAGTTGSGKSVAINTMILSLLYRLNPEECRLIMVDPKMLELSVYDGIPHLLTPVVTDPQKAVTALKWAVREMEDRYRKMARLGVRNIDGYNSRAAAARQSGEQVFMQVQTGFAKGTGEPIFEEREIDLSPMPFIVIIVDEMADLMMVAGKEIEGAIQRLAQMARAAGIHLIMATQRPSVDVITGTIKANFPTRISFQVTSKIDSRTILGEQGAEQLLGQGDMLHMAGGGRLARVHGPFVSDAEVEKVVAHLKAQATPEYLDTVTADGDAPLADEDEGDVDAAVDGDDGDALYAEAVKVVSRDKKCSTSYIQRRLGIGYNRAASLVERMEKEGLVGAPNHVGKREILSGQSA